MVSFNNDRITIQTGFDKDQHSDLVDALLTTCQTAITNRNELTERSCEAVAMVLDLTNSLTLQSEQMKTDNTQKKAL
jgi:riboflavin biosynthesis pyrimidine reductase